MSEDRAFIATFPGGGTHWAIERADGHVDWTHPCGGMRGADNLQRQWLKLWNKEAKRLAEHGLAVIAKLERSS